MNHPLDPSPLPWRYDQDDNTIRAADGTEVCRFPTQRTFPIDRANGRFIARLAEKFYQENQQPQEQP